MTPTLRGVWIWAAGAMLVAGTLLADRVHLVGGGVAKGKILEVLPDGVRIKTVGGVLFIAREKIANVAYEKTREDIYEEAKRLYADTAADQFKLAQWCAKHRLRKQMRTHLKRVIELDPEHAEARRMLGTTRRDGKWVSGSEGKRRDGYVRYKGRWMLPLEKEIMEREDRAKTEAQHWYRKCRTIAALLAHKDHRRRQDGYVQLKEITDPTAIKPMFDMLTRGGESVRLLLVEALGRFPEKGAKLALVKLALVDRSSEVREKAITTLGEHADPMILVWLTRALKSGRSTLRDRAVEALAAIGDLSVVPALVDVLVTKHQKRVTEPARLGIGTVTPYVVGHTAEVERGAVGVAPRVGYVSQGVSLGGTGTRVVTVTRKNRNVLEALIGLTGKNFAYSRKAWRNWYETVGAKEAARKSVVRTAPPRAPTTSPSRP